MVGARAPGTEQISQLASLFNQSKMAFFDKGSGGVQGLRIQGGVGGRGTGPGTEQI